MNNLLILGIGNPYISDDGVGIFVSRELRKFISDKRVECKEFSNSGFDALNLLEGYQHAIIVDAAKTGKIPIGQFQIFSHEELTALANIYSLHTFGILSAIQLASILSLPLPLSITVFAVEVLDTKTFDEQCTPVVACAIPNIINAILEYVEKIIPDVNILPDKIKLLKTDQSENTTLNTDVIFEDKKIFI